MANIDDLKATYEQLVVAFNSRTFDAFVAGFHDQIVVFDENAPFATDGKAALRAAVQTLFATHESITLTTTSHLSGFLPPRFYRAIICGAGSRPGGPWRYG